MINMSGAAGKLLGSSKMVLVKETRSETKLSRLGDGVWP